MKKVLIITYYWPPGGGAGVQRWLKFVKYLRKFGWEPVIYTPENGEIPVEDPSLMKDIPEGVEIIKTKIWEPYNLYKKFVGQKSNEKINTGFLTEKKKPSLLQKISVWIRGNLFIPDARKFWINPSIRYLTNYLKTKPVDVIISSGPPHSMHLIALGLREKLNLPWIADFRDPWTHIDYYKDLMLSESADRKHHRLEMEVLQKADRVLVIGETMKKEFQELFTIGLNSSEKKSFDKFHVITNGYDEDDIIKANITLDKKFSIAHIGTMVRTRNPEMFWKVISIFRDQSFEFANALEIKLVGKIDHSVWESIDKYKLTKFVNQVDYLPHNEVTKVQQQSQLLLLIVNNTHNAKGILTGKLFEYLAAKRPILCIGPTYGDAANIIQETESGVTVDFKDENKMTEWLKKYFSSFIQGSLRVNSKEIENYSRETLTGKLSSLMNELVVAN